MKRGRQVLVVMVMGAVLFTVPPADLIALGVAPYPTGPVKFESYTPEKGVVQAGEKSRFHFVWNGIPAAEAAIEVKPDPKRPGWICATAGGKIYGQVSSLYRAEDSVSSCMDQNTFKADVYSIRIRESLDYYDMTVKFNHAAGTAERKKKTRNKETTKTFKFSNAYCPVGTYFLVRSLPWKPGDERKFEVIDGNERYLLVLKALNYEQIKVAAGTFKAIRIQPSIFEMPSDNTRETPKFWERQKAKDKRRLSLIKSFSLWMMAEPPRQILRIRTDVFFGHVDADLLEIKLPDKKI